MSQSSRRARRSPPAAHPVRVLLVDDNSRARAAVVDLLSTEKEITVVGAAATLSDATAAIAATKPDVLVVDPDLPDGDGLSLCRPIADGRVRPVLVLTSDYGPHLVIDAVRAGARGLLVKNPAMTALADSIHRIAAGDSVLDDYSSTVVIEELRRRALNSANAA